MIRTFIRLLFPSILVSTVIMGTGFVVSQHMIRTATDDSLVGVAQHVVDALVQSGSYDIPTEYHNLEIDMSINPFVIVFDSSNEIRFTTGYIDRRTPVPPLTVFDRVRDGREYRFSWEPAPGVRIAAIAVRFDGESSGFVLVGKSLTETEERIDDIATMYMIGWAALTAALLVFSVMLRPKSSE
ncbi:MAG: hypothetical protein KBC33_00465 [Candidatus Pacebacteria bacterium]|nr:hypothetical protein [Candidatus Paceibacterota bacterium]